MITIKTFTAAEIAAYNASHVAPHRKVQAAQIAEAKLPPIKPRRDDRGDKAEQTLEHKMLHGEKS